MLCSELFLDGPYRGVKTLKNLRIQVSYYNDDAKRTKGMYRQRNLKAWGHTAHRGWARLLLDRARDHIIQGPAHRGAKGAAMSTDKDDQDKGPLARAACVTAV